MGFETLPTPPQKSQLEIDAIQDERIDSDAQLIREGARTEIGILQPTDDQIATFYADMQREQFEDSTDKSVLTDRISKLKSIRRALNFYFNSHAGPLAGQERERMDAEYNAALTEISASRPQTQEEAQQLFDIVTKKIIRLSDAISLMERNDKLRVGVSLNVRRSSGEIEYGWRVQRVTPEAEFVVVDNTGTLEKTVSIQELAKVNG